MTLRPWTGEPRGILSHDWNEERVALGRYAPGAEVAPFVEYFWSARWDLRGLPPRLEKSLPHPCVHVVLEPSCSQVVGVVRGRFERQLAGKSEVFGIKFHPGGFRPLLDAPVSRLTDRVRPIGELFGAAGERLETDVLASDPARRAAVVESFLRERLPPPDAELSEVRALAVLCRDDREITMVADLARRAGIGARRLQRLFARNVGVGPKWVIQRYRLHEAVARLSADEPVDYAALALKLGYVDQAHFIRDFATVVGRPPACFAETLRRERAR